MEGINWHHRVIVAGETNSGKSEVLNYLFDQVRCQRLLVDTKPEFEIPDVPITRSVEEIDWTQPLIHYRPSTGEVDEYDELFEECYHRRHLVVRCDELGDLCEDQPGKAPRYVRRYCRGGNIFGLGGRWGSQRLVCIPKQARTESQHFICMTPGLDPDDFPIAASIMGVSKSELQKALEEAQALSDHEDGKYAAVWSQKGSKELVLLPPLDAAVIRNSTVKRAVQLPTETRGEET